MAVPADWRRFALLLIDVQRDFWSEERAKAFPDFKGRIGGLLAYSRSSNLDVIHVRAAFEPDGTDWMAPYRVKGETPCLRGTPGAAVLAWAAEQDGEPVVGKQTFDAFLETDLLTRLQRARKSYILLAGLETSVCVLLTAASAVQRGFLAAVIEDCCADDSDRHKGALDGYPFIFDRTRLKSLETDRDRWMESLNKLDQARGCPWTN